MSVSKAAAKKHSHLNFIYIANPLCPSESRNVVLKKYSAKKTLAKYLGPLEGEWAVSVSGRVYHRSEWDSVRLQKDDCVVVAPVLLGGGEGGSKQILRLVAMVALSFMAPAAAMAMGGVWLVQRLA